MSKRAPFTIRVRAAEGERWQIFETFDYPEDATKAFAEIPLGPPPDFFEAALYDPRGRMLKSRGAGR